MLDKTDAKDWAFKLFLIVGTVMILKAVDIFSFSFTI